MQDLNVSSPTTPLRVLIVTVVAPARHLSFGGGEQVMSDLLDVLDSAQAEVTVLCPENSYLEDETRGRIRIVPCLRTWGYVWGLLERTSPHLRMLDLADIGRHARNCDLVISIDRPFPLHVPQPVVLMLLTGAYWEVLRAIFMPTYDRVIVPSTYLFAITEALAGRRYWTGTAPTHSIVPAVVDTSRFAARPVEDLAARLGLDTNGRYLLSPHRAELDKGFETSVDLLAELARSGTDHQLLIPLRDPTSQRSLDFQGRLRDRARTANVDDRLVFHDWVPAEEMARYLSLGEWTLRLGSLPEAFGLLPLQSVSCGTPVLCTPAGALQETLPDRHGLRRIWFGDIEAAADIIVNDRPSAEELALGRDYISAHYNRSLFDQRMLNALGATAKEERHFDPSLPTAERVAPWCTEFGGRFWHDYLGKEVVLPAELADLVVSAGDLVKRSLLPLGSTATCDEMELARSEGLVIKSASGEK